MSPFNEIKFVNFVESRHYLGLKSTKCTSITQATIPLVFLIRTVWISPINDGLKKKRLEALLNQLFTLTGLAQSKVVRMTPISGVMKIMRSVNLGKYS